MHLDAASNAGWYFADQAGELSNINQWFYTAMSTLGDYIGSDSAAQQFSAAYAPRLDSLDKGMLGLVQQLYGVGTTLDQLTKQFAGQEHASGDAFRRLGQSLRPSRTGHSGHGHDSHSRHGHSDHGHSGRTGHR